jgi:chaperonin GroES
MAAKLNPLRDRLVVERSEAEEKTSGGILLPDTAKDKPKQGTVVAVGPGRTLDDGSVHPLEVKVGDRILFGAYAGNEVKIGTTEYLVMNESDVLAVIEDEKGTAKKKK